MPNYFTRPKKWNKQVLEYVTSHSSDTLLLPSANLPFSPPKYLIYYKKNNKLYEGESRLHIGPNKAIKNYFILELNEYPKIDFLFFVRWMIIESFTDMLAILLKYTDCSHLNYSPIYPISEVSLDLLIKADIYTTTSVLIVFMSNTRYDTVKYLLEHVEYSSSPYPKMIKHFLDTGGFERVIDIAGRNCYVNYNFPDRLEIDLIELCWEMNYVNIARTLVDSELIEEVILELLALKWYEVLDTINWAIIDENIMNKVWKFVYKNAEMVKYLASKRAVFSDWLGEFLIGEWTRSYNGWVNTSYLTTFLDHGLVIKNVPKFNYAYYSNITGCLVNRGIRYFHGIDIFKTFKNGLYYRVHDNMCEYGDTRIMFSNLFMKRLTLAMRCRIICGDDNDEIRAFKKLWAQSPLGTSIVLSDHTNIFYKSFV